MVMVELIFMCSGGSTGCAESYGVEETHPGQCQSRLAAHAAVNLATSSAVVLWQRHSTSVS